MRNCVETTSKLKCGILVRWGQCRNLLNVSNYFVGWVRLELCDFVFLWPVWGLRSSLWKILRNLWSYPEWTYKFIFPSVKGKKKWVDIPFGFLYLAGNILLHMNSIALCHRKVEIVPWPQPRRVFRLPFCLLHSFMKSPFRKSSRTGKIITKRWIGVFCSPIPTHPHPSPPIPTHPHPSPHSIHLPSGLWIVHSFTVYQLH